MRRALMTVAAVLLTTTAAHATLMEALSMRQLTDRADHIAVVQVLSQRSVRDARQRIVTDATVRVEETLKGPSRPGDQLTIRRLGGAIGDIGMRVEGTATFHDGHRYLVFLRERGGQLGAVGMSQGVMELGVDANGTVVTQPGGAGLALVQRQRDGQLVPAPAALLHPRPLSDVRIEIQRTLDD